MTDRRSFLKHPLALACLLVLPPALRPARAAGAPSEYLKPDHNNAFIVSNEAFMKVVARVAPDTVTLQAMGVGLVGEPAWGGPGWAPAPVGDTTLRLRYWLDTPDGARAELGVVSYPYRLYLPRAALPAAGWISLSGEVVTATTRPVPIGGTPQVPAPASNRFLANPVYLGAGGDPRVPLAAIRILSSQDDGGCVDWLAPPASGRFAAPAFTAYPLRTLPSQGGVAPSAWVKESPWGPGLHYIESFPRWRAIGGVVQAEPLRAGANTSDLASATEEKKLYPVCGGAPGLAATTTFATARGNRSANPDPMWFEMDGQGRFWGYHRDGTITPLAGPRMPSDATAIPDETLSTYATVGSFPDGPPKHAHDFCFDASDPLWIYVADTDNHRLLRIDRHAAASGASETYAAWVFSAWGAAFSTPTSIDASAGGTLYVVDSTGLWAVDRASGAKTSLWTQANLFWVRALSTGRLCVTDTSGKIFRFDPATRAATLLADVAGSSTWPILSIDTRGLVGPVDSAYYVDTASYVTWRIDQDNDPDPGSTASPNPRYNQGLHADYFGDGGNGYAAHGRTLYCQDAPGHYMWNAEVHTSEPYVFVRGFANTTPWLIRPMQPAEAGGPLDQWHDSALEYAGREMMRRGTVQGFPWGARPSFTALMSSHGHTGLGVAMFDAIQAMPLPQRIAYLQAGLGGGTPRPEIVGDALRTLLWWIWRNSRQYLAGVAFDGPAAGADTTAPSISFVSSARDATAITWSWTTDRPALCYVRFGERLPLHRWTPLEGGFATTHTAIATHAPAATIFQVVALGSNGVLAEGPVSSTAASGDIVPPPAPAGLA